LALVLIGGGIAVWYFGFRPGTALVVTVGQTDASARAIPGIDCSPFITNSPRYEQSPGGGFTLAYDCTNTLAVDKEVTVDTFDLDMWAWDTGTGCQDQDDIPAAGVWPPALSESTVFGMAPHTYGPSTSQCPTSFVPGSIQEGDGVTPTRQQSMTIPAGATVNIQTQHVFPNCNFYQFDDIMVDVADPSTRGYLGAGVVRSSADAATCPNAPADLGDLQIRIYEDLDQNGEYTDPPAGEGAVFAGHAYKVFVGGTRTEIDYATLCDGGDAVVGGAGRDTCRGLTPGTYDVDVDPDITAPYQGPINDPHNPNGDDPYTVTVVANQTATADFGYIKPVISADKGDLQIRIYEDLDKNSEYTDPPAGEGAAFAGHAYRVFLSGTRTEIDYATLCDGGDAVVGGAGRDTCRGLQVGDYDVDVDPDITAPYQGPIDEPHNPNGDDPYTVTVVANQTATADFGYTQGVVGQGIACVVTSTPSPATGQKPLTVAFDGSASQPGTGQTITNWSWNFGDGSTGIIPNLPNVSHDYTAAGSYTMTLTVTNSAGNTDSCSLPVSVLQGPISGVFDLNVIAFNDKDEDGVQDPNNCSQTEFGYNGATVTVTDAAGTVVGTKDTDTGPQAGPVPCHGWAVFDSLQPGTYEVCIDEADRPELDSTGNTFLLQSMKRTVPAASCANVTLGPSATVLFGYNPRPVVQALQCELNKTVTDTTPANEGTPDDPGTTVSSPGEVLTYSINWTCTGFVSNFSFVITDTYDNLLTVQDSSITGGGVHNAANRTIIWNVPNSSGLQVASGNVSFNATIDSPLAPGTYTLPNYVVMAGRDGQVIDQDQTTTTVVVPPGTTTPDIEVIKLCEDVNGGTLQPNDVVECDIVVWNNGNAPLNNVRITDNMPPFVHGFTRAIPPLPTGATDNSQLAPAGSNQTGFLDVSGFNLTNQGDVATITYRVTVDAGVPTGTVISNLVTATSGTVSDTDVEDVTVGGVVPTPPTPPAPGPSSGPLPPPLGPRVFVPSDDAAAPDVVEDAGISMQNWVLIASAIVAAAIATFVYSRLKLRPE